MKRLIVVLVVLALCAGGALAQWGYGYGATYAEEAYEGFRVELGWVNPSDFDAALSYGASYIWKNALLAANYYTSDASVAGGTVDGKFWNVEASYLFRNDSDPGLYYGGGLGLLNLDWDFSPTLAAATAGDSGKDSRMLWHVVVGKEFYREGQYGGNNWFLEARYSFGNKIQGLNVSNLKVSAGWRF